MAQILSPEQSSRISILRQKVLEGSISIEEMQEIIITLRQGRTAAASAAESGKKKSAKTAIPHADDLLNDL